MRVLMLGWEFPPYISGGLGTACFGLTNAMKRQKTRILFVLPRATENLNERSIVDVFDDDVDDLATTRPGINPLEALKLLTVRSPLLSPYEPITRPVGVATTTEPTTFSFTQLKKPRRKKRRSSVHVLGVGAEDGYGGDLIWKINDYSDRCRRLIRKELFDVIHAHDWITFPAGMAIAARTGKPLVVHVHATEYDRSGEHVNRPVYDIERKGVHAAAKVIAVSDFTKAILVKHYGVPEAKVQVVHNGIEGLKKAEPIPARSDTGQKTVLFLGRLTLQKGPEFFVRAAARVAERVRNVRFVIAGNGDLLPHIQHLVWELGLQEQVDFLGFVRGEDVRRAYRGADVYVMPSISEPFGLTALEAARDGTPVVLSKSSGVSEVLKRGALKVDFWDIELMARSIVHILKYPALREMLRNEAFNEIRSLTWDAAAHKCLRVYQEAVAV